MYFCNSYASNWNGMRYVVWMSVQRQWNRPKIVETQNQFLSHITQSKTETKYDHSCSYCHIILEKLVILTPEKIHLQT